MANSIESSPIPRPEGARDRFIDFLRGLCVLSMIFTHAGQQTVVIHLSLSGTIGFFSGAEGFFFLSGLVFGRVYRKRMLTHGVSATGTAIWRRVLKLYKYHVACIGCMLLVGLLFPSKLRALDDTYDLAVQHPMRALAEAALLVYQPNLLDVLPLYVVYLPLAWFLIRSECENSRWVPLVSSALWVAQQFAATAFGCYVSPGAFNVLSYQFVFFLGLWAARGLPLTLADRRGQFSWVLVVSILIVCTCFVMSHAKHLRVAAVDLGAVSVALNAQADKFSLGWLRLLNFVAMAAFLQQARAWLRWVPLQPVAALGRRSLGIFAGHVVLLILLCGPMIALRHLPSPLVLLLVVGTVAAIAFLFYFVDVRQQRIALTNSASKAATCRSID